MEVKDVLHDACELDILCADRRGHKPKEFEAFVTSNGLLLRRYIARTVVGTEIELDDVLQDGLERIWKEWSGWPLDPESRTRNALRTAHCVAVDANRRLYGREGTKPRTVPVDFLDSVAPKKGLRGRNRSTSSLKQLLERRVMATTSDIERVDEAIAISRACRALREFELKVLINLGVLEKSHREVAKELGVSVKRVTSTYYEARQVLQKLIAHAALLELPRVEAVKLDDLLSGRLKGRERRIARRHYEYCSVCQRTAAS